MVIRGCIVAKSKCGQSALLIFGNTYSKSPHWGQGIGLQCQYPVKTPPRSESILLYLSNGHL